MIYKQHYYFFNHIFEIIFDIKFIKQLFTLIQNSFTNIHA